ncbi:hypothetical protein J2X63_000734 [Agromyces sp. 3263]|uniref:hypothetical protein n=1 Tax=Agromyces sp. 3263 TaxID=2817750 RepID=UPI0028644652|nr:hypothetical protein [Agromyces sp. 3263]MDR6905048.1 hypothetical protein [Agromyces sp. 3263]
MAGLDFMDRLAIVEHRGLIDAYGENAMSRDALQRIAAYGPLWELGAGGGYTARLLKDLGAEVVASDPKPPVIPWTEVRWGTYETDDVGDSIPLLVWPYMNAALPWLRSERAPHRLIVVNDVAPNAVGAHGIIGYLSEAWTHIETFPAGSGWRRWADYVHVWDRPNR